MSNARLQDLPPPGGYQKIIFERIPARTYFGGYTMFLGYVGITTAGLYLYFLNYRQVKKNDIEMRSSRLALLPLLLAERDREYLKQLQRNRDEETELMKNVKGWETGTWFGEKMFKTIPDDVLINPTFQEYYAHASYKAYAERANLKLYS